MTLVQASARRLIRAGRIEAAGTAEVEQQNVKHCDLDLDDRAGRERTPQQSRELATARCTAVTAADEKG